MQSLIANIQINVFQGMQISIEFLVNIFLWMFSTSLVLIQLSLIFCFLIFYIVPQSIDY